MTVHGATEKPGNTRVRIHIGEIYTTSEPTVIETILGSCVSVCLIDPAKKIGGMNHILLPGRADIDRFDDATRYGINAMEVLINSMMKLGSSRHRIRAKIFGGAHIIRSIARHMAPGVKNVRFVDEFLEREDIPVVSRNTGGTNGRKIYFHTATGDVYLKKLANPQFEAIAREEDQITELVENLMDVPTDIEIFQREPSGR